MGKKETGQVKTETPTSDHEAEQRSTPSSTTEKKKINIYQLVFDVIQAFGAAATVVAALMAFWTLKEMQTERDNAYKPEIVVSPNTFEGGRLDVEDSQTDKKHVYINYNTSDPGSCYSEKPSGDSDYLFLEIPYLTLRNIGHGTAKDVQISFSPEWLESAVTELNDLNDGYHYEIEILNERSGEQMYQLHYSNKDGTRSFYLSESEDLIKKYTYISSDDATVNVALPEGWVKMLAVIYGRECWSSMIQTDPDGAGYLEAEIPNLEINIQYTDMQGKSLAYGDPVPWTAYYQYVISEDSTGRKPSSIHLQTHFYEDYTR